MFSPCYEWQEATCETSEGDIQTKEDHFHFLMMVLKERFQKRKKKKTDVNLGLYM